MLKVKKISLEGLDIKGFENLGLFYESSKSLFYSIMETCRSGLFLVVESKLDIAMLVKSRLDVGICERSG